MPSTFMVSAWAVNTKQIAKAPMAPVYSFFMIAILISFYPFL
ncbi:hypothetical protein MRBBS_3382 [Marinobacter sp. BSs20148]|nr:hypothetical protein MRBBS_3382 [Marinobacter sp. BSs20148]